MSIRSVDSKRFFDTVSSSEKEFILVDFSAEWCSPCKKIEPKLKQLSQLHTSVEFIKVDADECPDLMDRYDVESIPTFIFFKRGDTTPFQRISGARVVKLEEALQKLPVTATL